LQWYLPIRQQHHKQIQHDINNNIGCPGVMQQRNTEHDEDANQKWKEQGKPSPIAGNNPVATITAN
jgi:hypothetical protein